MKDIKGITLKTGDDVLIIEDNGKVPASILGIGKSKIKLQLHEGVIVVNHDEVKIKKITANGLQGERHTTGLLEEIFKTTSAVKTSRDLIPGVDINALRLFGVNFDKAHSAMRLTEGQKKYNTYGKVYRLLKEAFDQVKDDEELEDVAEAISKIATYLNNKMDK